jgi:phosphatidylserine decarboxylase
MAKDGYYFLLPLLLLAVLLLLFGMTIAGVIFLALGAFVAYFFRDPERVIPEDPRAVVSPADGRVVDVQRIGEATRVSIFLSVFDVHINRAPLKGTLTRKEYRPGKFLLAWDERASVENEQVDLTIESDGRRLDFALIAGILARRISVWKQPGDALDKGDRIGLIRFGSRVDIVLPEQCSVLVTKGDRVYGGTSVIAHWRSDS